MPVRCVRELIIEDYRDYEDAKAELTRALAPARPFYALVTGPSGMGKTRSPRPRLQVSR